MIILLSNDDGIQSEGLTALEDALQSVADIYTVAPDRAQSSMSHALTLHRPLRMQRLLYAVNAILEPQNMIAAGVFCGNTFISSLVTVRFSN